MSEPDNEPLLERVDVNLDGKEVSHISDIDRKVVDDADGVEKPGRNIKHISAAFNKTRHGDDIKLIYGTTDYKVTFSGEVIGIKGQNSTRAPNAGWERTYEILGPEGELNEQKGRLYRMGHGGDKSDPWLIYSYEYNKLLGKIIPETGEWHGWIVDAQRIPDKWE